VEQKQVLGFDGQQAVRWLAVNDDVMGGQSESALRLTPEGTGVFEGRLSLANSGGFASIRAHQDDYGLEGYDGLAVRVRGDGRRYKLRLRTNRFLDGPAYEATFATEPDRWMTAELPFADFVATFRGRRLADAPPLDVASVQQIGFMIADRREGSFQLEIAWVKAYRSAE
jgi:hypothetical protein